MHSYYKHFSPPPIQWGVFPCGHTLCATCTKTLLQRRAHSSFLNCPICRLSCIASDINYVRLGEGGEEKEEVKGIHASKIVSVVQTLLRIRKQEPRAKALVFSWVGEGGREGMEEGGREWRREGGNGGGREGMEEGGREWRREGGNGGGREWRREGMEEGGRERRREGGNGGGREGGNGGGEGESD